MDEFCLYLRERLRLELLTIALRVKADVLKIKLWNAKRINRKLKRNLRKRGIEV